MSPTTRDAEQLLILAPVGRDAPLLQGTLGRAGFACQVVADAQMLRQALQGEVGVLLLTAEALSPPVLQVLQTFLASQPPWSNLPLVLLVDEHNLVALRQTLLDLLGAESQVTLLARPVTATTLVAVLQVALWVRRRQYEVRTLLKQLEHQNATLEQRVEERTAELVRSNRELDQFAYVASHDLKAPLRAISHLASWVVEDVGEDLPPSSQRHLAKLQERIRRMENLLADLLEYSRAGRQHHPLERVDTATLVRNVIELLNPPPGFTVTLPEPLPSIVTERVPLETVLRNLIGNALKHHPNPATGKVILTAQVQDACVAFTVADNGAGIDPRFHTRIFEIFQTLQPRDEVEGSGMGLTVVKKLVESRGGTIEIISSVGEGATFRFTWPITTGLETAGG